jgi:hypothetical protein
MCYGVGNNMNTQTTFENLGSLITIANTNNCLGYLMNFSGHGIFDASLGKVDITPEQADIHNRLFDQAMIKGLDTCQIGQCGTFYWGGNCVKTFMGTVVSYAVTHAGQSVTFKVKEKTFRGRLQKDADCFNFKRIS